VRASKEIHEAVNALEFGADDCPAVLFDRAEPRARERVLAPARRDARMRSPQARSYWIKLHCLLVNGTFRRSRTDGV
jgi:hypothetical protein